MYEVFVYEGNLLLKYSSDNGVDWVWKKIENGPVIFKRGLFILPKSAIFKYNNETDENEYLIFKLGELIGDYYLIPKEYLGIESDVYIHASMEISFKMFFHNGVKVFRKLADAINWKDQSSDKTNIIIGTGGKNRISKEEFALLLNNIPTQVEIEKYTNSRVQGVIFDIFDNLNDASWDFDQYMKKKYLEKTRFNSFSPEIDIERFKVAHKKLSDMLDDVPAHESHWQNEILKIIKLLFPKYITIEEKVRIDDDYTNKKYREIDLLLIDYSGVVDLIEVKTPKADKNGLLAPGKVRDRYVPYGALSAAVVQAEHYIFLLNKGGQKLEQQLTKRFHTKNCIPNDVSIQIISPKSILILGRDSQFNDQQMHDFELIKRQYSNVVDIISYDDLLRRINRIINMLEFQVEGRGSN